MNDTEKVKVAFRKFEDNNVIALFPDMINGKFIGSYMHIGQHSDASPELLQDLEPCKPEEYQDLLKELIRIGYDPEIIPEK